MDDDERPVLICGRLSDARHLTRGRRGRCDLCNEAVWVSRTSRHALKRGAVPRCFQCAADTVEPGARVEPPTEEQLREVRSKLPIT